MDPQPHVSDVCAHASGAVPAGIVRDVPQPSPILRVWRQTQSGVDVGDSDGSFARVFVEHLSGQVVAGHRSLAIDLVYDYLDRLLLDKLVVEASDLMLAVARSDLPLPILLSALTISLPWRNETREARAALVDAAWHKALQEGGEEKAKAALRGLF